MKILYTFLFTLSLRHRFFWFRFFYSWIATDVVWLIMQFLHRNMLCSVVVMMNEDAGYIQT